MKNATVFETADIKKLLAEKCGVPEDHVIKSQYTFTVILPDDKPEDERSGSNGNCNDRG